jgi:cellobiose epimerase
MSAHSYRQLSREFSDQLFGHILPFWCGPALDREQGGWMGCLSNDLKPDRTGPKGLIVNTRILWALSAAFRARPEPVYREMADRAFDYVIDHFWDAKHGGAFWRLDDRGRVIEDVKKTYGQSFCIYALAEYWQAFGRDTAGPSAIRLFELLERHAHDPAHGGYFEVCKPDWSGAADVALSEKDQNEKKTMNSHLHVLEAYSNLYRVWKDPRVAQRLRELIRLFEQSILNVRTHHLHHYFDEQWQVRSDSYTFGHDIEASWLLCEAAELLDAPLLERIRGIALRMADAVLVQALDADGAICCEGRGGKIIDPRKECWSQAEAVIGFLNAFQISGDPKFFAAARRVWEYIDRRLVDRVHGEWFWRINEDGRPDPTLPKVSEWKGPYHGSRMCLEAMHRLKHLAD